jgi:HD superfamily phosphohydrolase
MAIANKKKIINDPVYGFINIRNEEIFDLISHPYLQRLRRIKQLGLTNLVYPGAEHTRFAHCLGTMYLMSKALDILASKGVSITEKEYSAAQTAILLHDIGHSPFSHALERCFFSCKHEDISLLLMKKMNIDDLAISIFTNQYDKKFLHQLVSSQVDCDRLDYLTRDSFFTGVSEGVIGTERILNMLNVSSNGELVIDEKGIYSIEKFIISRRLMYWQVYMHKSVVAADNLLLSILERVKDLIALEKSVNESHLSSALLFFLMQENVQPNEESLANFVALDDVDVWSAIKTWANNDDKILSCLTQALLKRNLGKVRFLQTEEIEQCKNKSGKYFLRCDLLQNTAYSFNDEKINILYRNGALKEIFNASDQLDKAFLSKEIKKYFLYEFAFHKQS